MDIIRQMIVPARKETLVDAIHNKILEMIIRENVTEESVFTEGRLVQQFEVSKATVREALVRLCNENILRSIPRYGYVIAHLDKKVEQDICEFRKLLEGASLEKCLSLLGGEDYRALDGLLERHQREKSQYVWDVWQKNIEFHCLLVSCSKSDLYTELLHRVMQQQAIFFAKSRWKAGKSFQDKLHAKAHANILSAIKDKDREKAQSLLLGDISWSF